MTAYIPYLVVLAVVIIFFFVCYLVFRDKEEPVASRPPLRETVVNADYYERKRSEHGAHYRAKPADKPAVSATAEEPLEATQIMPAPTKAKQTPQAAKKKRRQQHTPAAHTAEPAPMAQSGDTTDATVVIGTREELARHMAERHSDSVSAPASDNDVTRPITPINVRTMEASEVADDATRILPIVKGDTANRNSHPVPASAPAAGGAVEWAVAHFMQSFGMLGDTAKNGVKEITSDALRRLGITDEQEVKALLENIVVQEALMCMQKAYVATPTPWMYETAIEAFCDVVQQPKSSTLYLLAFDALRILPHLHLGHFQIMALALLLQYSRNSNNYSLENLRHYVAKYIEPFVSELPRDESMHRQLEYLHCSAPTADRVGLAPILSNSYPLIFKYRGFTKDELSMVLEGERLDEHLVVRSINSSMYKLALVDEGLAQRFFRMAHISDGELQQGLLALAKSKPTAFTGRESMEIMERISPVLTNLAEVYDKTPISKMTLTLLGLYLGRAHVKVTIGEEFDLSPWL